MTIGVISDTHLFSRKSKLPDTVLYGFSKVHHIVHAGDVFDENVIFELERIAPVTAVAGNLDSAALKHKYNMRKIVTFEKYKFGICHGHEGKGKTADRAIYNFKYDTVDCIIFGHSHMPYCQYHQGTLLFNPGSPTDKRRNQFFSFGLIDTNGLLLPRIIFFNDKGIINP